MRGRRIPIALPNTGALSRRRHTLYIRSAIIVFILFAFLQFHMIYYDTHDSGTTDTANYSTAAILQMVPPVFHKYLTSKTRNVTHGQNGTSAGVSEGAQRSANISEILRMIHRYNELQTILNEDIFGPLQNDSVIIVVQVHKRITYLRHLIVSLAQAKDISRTMLVFSHDHFDDDINDLVQSIDFCKVMQVFYPFSIQTHPNEFPGADPGDCPRDIKKEQALLRKCKNALHPDLYGHYREAKFTQTKHHWWWKANRVFDQLEVTKYHTGLVVFLEEDHYVAEDFLYILELMQQKSQELCPKCNILSLGTYLKTFNYYTYNKKRATGYGGKPFSYQGKTSLVPVATGTSLEHNAAGLASSHLHQHSYHHQSYPFVDVSSLLSSGTSSDDGRHRDTDYNFPGYYHNRYMPRFQQKNPSNILSLSSVRGDGADSPAKIIGKHVQTYIASPIANEPINNQNRLLMAYSNSYPATTAERSPSHHSAPPQQQKQQQQQLQQQLQQQQLQRQQQASGTSGLGYNGQATTEKYASQSQWGYQVLPTLYSIYQKVEVTPWISSKHNMGMAFNRTTWHEITRCALHFCEYDDYNWDWSLQHVSQQCLKQKLHVMVVKGPRVFHIGECGVHHKKSNCESNQVISKVQQVLRVARRSRQLYPKSISLMVASVIKKTKLRKGNGGWGDQRDHQLCFNITLIGR
ncbi:alpha-1,6-mannosyl-glycoprotein 2-beta-N-acetylglucosaminyltransferase isoform X1 [Toxorhynchites rutilus septentrionalis]|uniref:alpha-1,6-mannosyl-glycoprotein 2-beta-N-acetylglucosaminyltransferase isoform X1 n=1 Tax=Toxorhynchites rutilus septentrionalis TaxID=329112 RepID=UPI002479AA06|nr:alpha-1,6-mannosyl-glycoprotein 2-beta-N-acetylglucosaminyltransferase isoform X1 [Toxorhynchites rutilus septentrionalis]XP_055628378.1 alpha-1,6-mannosyl-glycoprotein 2-beta-N-acetylglucosaminyltransferase isoform X1 [Toxorhynchites rutilus septentrionalis]XP_055628456.1 alpha-1,6-mannosyl-glycoprotein 2-beta-N-acetylglucosaminyltransferase isoform X1 [Toxorhynchites rutilus septentrionalis]XP_055628534.1 alpha-1,6-mannosyl-glycoprotein 2-beta-N-acetylglucosaminyltransferase isoform X1 [Tox